MSREGRVRTWALVAAAVGVLALAELPVAWHYLVSWPQDQWQVDLEVYREAGRSILYGRPVYEHMTESPQLLPFTYPPFAALLALPLVLLPFHAAGWVWTALQVAATAATVWIAFAAFLSRVGPRWAVLAGAVLTAPMLWLHPVADGVRFGQVNAFIVLACLADLALPPSRWARWPRGLLIGVVTAVKLTPGVFLIHLALCRRWRELGWAVAGAAGATVLGFLVLPEASLTFWGGALQDPARLGPNAGTSNQSLRGFLLRVGPQGLGGSVLWLVLVAVVGWVGFTLARRAHDAGDRVAEVAAVGLMAVLLSPVAWIHHLAWVVVVVGALLGDGRSRQRVVSAAVVTGWFLCRMPWWGITWLDKDWWHPFGRMLQNADTAGALLALGLLWSVVTARPSAGSPQPGLPAPARFQDEKAASEPG